MVKRRTSYLTLPQSQLTSNVFIPLFILLTFIAVINSIQATYMSKGHGTPAMFVNFILSKTLYCWYYLFLAVIIQQLSARVHLNRKSVWQWITLHLIILVATISFHQFLSLEIDTLIWHGKFDFTFFNFLLGNIFVWVDVTIYIFFLLVFHLLEYQRLNRDNDIRYSQLEVQLLRSQLQELRSIIHPQFLFNTMESISGLLRNKRNSDADQLLSLLGNFLRTTIYDAERDEITLREELNFLHQYLAIEKIRYPDGFTIHEQLDPSAFSACVPGYFLQPLVENFVDQVLQRGQLPYELSIRITTDASTLVIEILDNRSDMKLSQQEESKNQAVLSITRDRLSHATGGQCALDIGYRKTGELSCRLLLPYREHHQEKESIIT